MNDCSTTLWFDLPNAPAKGAVVGNIVDITDGEPKIVFFESKTDSQTAFSLLLLKSGDSIRAYVNRCQHFGVPLAQKQEYLIFKPHTSISCNVHYARYRWHDGHCEFGDCLGESLIPVPISVDSEGWIAIAEI